MASRSPLPTPADVLAAVAGAFGEYVAEEDIRVVSELLLARILELSGSEYGFIGRVERTDSGAPQLRTTAITNIAWNDETRAMVERAGPKGLLFTNLNTLFGRVLASERPLISNSPSKDPRSGGLPPGHPDLRAFLGVPLIYRSKMVGMVGVSNRKGGYSQELVAALQPFFLVCGDIMEGWAAAEQRRTIEAALRYSEARHRLVLEAAKEAVITTDDRGVIQGVNAATEQLFGYTTDELLGQPVTIIMPHEYRDQHTTHMHRYVTTGVATGMDLIRELPARRKDGSEFPAELSLSEAIFDDTRLFTGILRDITQRTEAKANLQASLAEVERARGHLDQLLDDLSIGCVLLDESGRAEFVSRSCSWLMTPADLARAAHWREWMNLDAEQAATFEAMLRVADGDDTLDQLSFTARGGPERHFRLQVRIDPRDERRRLVYFHEITEMVELHERILEAEVQTMVGHSQVMQGLRSTIRQVGRGDWNVLVEGETGTGKELVARAIHDCSPRSAGPFVAINCAVLTPSLVASTLFGHRRGAFTGADRDHIGVVEAANGGTLLLDEVADLSPDVQVSLLRLVQEREFRRVGETRVRKFDIRILFATHQDLSALVADGRFRADLFYRIRVARVSVPPLRTREGDIRLLASTFVHRRSHDLKLSEAALRTLEQHPWPGNVRELEAVVEYACIQSSGTLVTVEHLPPELRSEMPAPSPQRGKKPSELSREEIIQALQLDGGNRSQAARRLGISRASLYRRLSELQLPGNQGAASKPV